MNFNYDKLKGRYISMGYAVEDLAEVLGISRTSMYKRLGNEIPFKNYEIVKLKEFLKIDSRDIDDIFFNQNVR